MKLQLDHPIAITMWDFSWLERRWAGAGFEDWGRALDELKARGYDAVRIDAYPHLISAGPEQEWMLLPEWDQQVWGAPAITKVDHILENLLGFLSICRAKGIRVGLSTWFRQDQDNTRMHISTPHEHAQIWLEVLRAIDRAGLLEQLLYVDLCNEFPLDCWAPFLRKGIKKEEKERSFRLGSPEATAWMSESIAELRESYPQLSYTFSFTDFEEMFSQDVSSLDILEPHIWMPTVSEFYKEVGYHFERFDSKGYENMALYAETLYRSKPEYWQKKLTDGITRLSEWSKQTGKPLITTECWGIVDYKDWPMLNWGWVKELCEIGTLHASASGQWAAVGTSNFCAPQFVGMWRDVLWHKRLTQAIHSGRLPESCKL